MSKTFLVTHTLTFRIEAEDDIEAEEASFPLDVFRAETWDTDTEEEGEEE